MSASSADPEPRKGMMASSHVEHVDEDVILTEYNRNINARYVITASAPMSQTMTISQDSKPIAGLDQKAAP